MKLLELANVVQDNHVVGVTASVSVRMHSLARSAPSSHGLSLTLPLSLKYLHDLPSKLHSIGPPC